MSESVKKKNRLRPTQYDEVSLVDAGANQDAHVLIYKRQDSGNASADLKWMQDHRTEIGRKAKAAAKKKSSKKTSTGTKSSGSSSSGGSSSSRKKGTTQRAKNWKEDRHPRNEKGSGDSSGEFKTTSADSKKKYGKGGTTKAKLEGKKTSGKGGTYKVKQGDTLWALAEKYLGDGKRWKELGKQVGITTDAQARKMQIGTKITIPGAKKSSSKKSTGKGALAGKPMRNPTKQSDKKKSTRKPPKLSTSRGHTEQEVGAEKYAKYKAKGWTTVPGDSSGRLYSPSALKTYNERMTAYKKATSGKTSYKLPVKKNDLLSQWMEG